MSFVRDVKWNKPIVLPPHLFTPASTQQGISGVTRLLDSYCSSKPTVIPGFYSIVDKYVSSPEPVTLHEYDAEKNLILSDTDTNILPAGFDEIRQALSIMPLSVGRNRKEMKKAYSTYRTWLKSIKAQYNIDLPLPLDRSASPHYVIVAVISQALHTRKYCGRFSGSSQMLRFICELTIAILARQENHLFTDYQIATLRIFLAKLFATDETRQVQLKPFYDIVESYASDPLGLRFIARSNDTDVPESSPGVSHAPSIEPSAKRQRLSSLSQRHEGKGGEISCFDAEQVLWTVVGDESEAEEIENRNSKWRVNQMLILEGAMEKDNRKNATFEKREL